MGFDIATLEPLAAQLAKAGAPILADALGTVLPFPVNIIAKGVINSLAAAFGVEGGANADPAVLAAKIAADPDAGAKLQSVTDQHAADIGSALDFAKLQTDANAAELAVPGAWSGALLAGWRPAFAWSVVLWIQIMLARALLGFEISAGFLALWNPIWLAFGGLLGLRTAEKFGGVATEALGKVAAALKARRAH